MVDDAFCGLAVMVNDVFCGLFVEEGLVIEVVHPLAMTNPTKNMKLIK